MNAVLRAWAAWAPGVEDRDAWRAWARNPTPLKSEGHPEARFLPAMLRRRCTPLTRTMLTAAFDCLPESELGDVRSVFASRHGSINESIDMLRQIVLGEKLSPAMFSHTVHNAQAGLFSIAGANREASSSLAGMQDSFASAYLEALTHLDREPGRPVLLVMGDVPLAETFAHLISDPPVAYAVALLLAREGEGERYRFSLEAGATPPGPRAWPDAAEFLRAHLAGEPEILLGSRRRTWRWQRRG